LSSKGAAGSSLPGRLDVASVRAPPTGRGNRPGGRTGLQNRAVPPRAGWKVRLLPFSAKIRGSGGRRQRSLDTSGDISRWVVTEPGVVTLTLIAR
jgi:hypothetical protein